MADQEPWEVHTVKADAGTVEKAQNSVCRAGGSADDTDGEWLPSRPVPHRVATAGHPQRREHRVLGSYGIYVQRFVHRDAAPVDDERGPEASAGPGGNRGIPNGFTSELRRPGGLQADKPCAVEQVLSIL